METKSASVKELEKELGLKNLQIKALLTITQAINDNIAAEGLYNMYRSILSWEMGIHKMALFVYSDDGWFCSTNINYAPNSVETFMEKLLPYHRVHLIEDDHELKAEGFDVIIPAFHKTSPIAYAIIGGIEDQEELYNKVQFISTITNVVAVAIENKRLFKKQVKQEVYKRDMELAVEVQQMLIPDILPKNNSYEISKIYKPHATVGGDYIDYIRFSEHRFAVCIADISGKGVSAAILMANFQAMIQSFVYQYRDMETFTIALNQAVYNITRSDRYITFFMAEIDTQQKTLKYVNAGHYPPVLINNGKAIHLDKGCPFLGAFEQLPFVNEESIDLSNDSLLLSFTDGLVELKNDAGDYFNDTRIESFALEHRSLDTESFNNRLLEEIEDFRGEGEFGDDIAILTCKIY